MKRLSVALATLVISTSLASAQNAFDYTDSRGAHPQGMVQTGTTGQDFSSNKPTIPNVGSNFAATGVYANYVLLKTIPAKPNRMSIDIENNSGAKIVLVFDDGTAAVGAAPANVTVMPIEGGSAAGSQGGSFISLVERGRVQIYALSSTAQVAARTN